MHTIRRDLVVPYIEAKGHKKSASHHSRKRLILSRYSRLLYAYKHKKNELSSSKQYRWSGSNRHSLRNTILSRARLPIPPHRQNMEAATGFEPVVKVLQTSALPLGYAAILNLERKTGFEPATPTLARLYSTTELLPQKWLG